MTEHRSRTFTLCVDRNSAGWKPVFRKGGFGTWRFYWLWIAIGYYPFDARVLATRRFEWKG